MVQASPAPLVICMRDCSRGVAYVLYCPYPALRKLDTTA